MSHDPRRAALSVDDAETAFALARLEHGACRAHGEPQCDRCDDAAPAPPVYCHGPGAPVVVCRDEAAWHAARRPRVWRRGECS